MKSDANGPHPWITYTVTACGPHPYTGALLLLGGTARISDAGPTATTAPNSAVSMRLLPKLALNIRSFGESVRFNSVQAVRLYLPAVPSCTANSPVSGGAATAYGVGGFMYGSIEHPWARRWDWWTGPQFSEVLPLTGAIPGLSYQFVGPIAATAGLAGSWVLPPQQTVRVISSPADLASSVESTAPALSSGTRDLDWTSQITAISPVAIITNMDATAGLQDVLGVAAVIAGAAVGLALTLAVDVLRTPRTPPPPAPAPALEPAPRPASFVITMAAAAIVVLSFIRRRR